MHQMQIAQYAVSMGVIPFYGTHRRGSAVLLGDCNSRLNDNQITLAKTIEKCLDPTGEWPPAIARLFEPL